MGFWLVSISEILTFCPRKEKCQTLENISETEIPSSKGNILTDFDTTFLVKHWRHGVFYRYIKNIKDYMSKTCYKLHLYALSPGKICICMCK